MTDTPAAPSRWTVDENRDLVCAPYRLRQQNIVAYGASGAPKAWAALTRVVEDEDMWMRMYLDSLTRWHRTTDVVLNTIAEGGSLARVVEVVADWIDGSDAWDDDVLALVHRAADAAGLNRDPGDMRTATEREADDNAAAARAALTTSYQETPSA